MSSRGRYLRRRYSARSKRHRLRLRRLENIAAYTGAVLLLFALILALRWAFFDGAKKLNITSENVAAFKIPHRAFTELKALSTSYGIDFAQAVSLYSIEHSFFPAKTEIPTDIEHGFIRNYDSIRKSYRAKDVEPYHSMLSTLIGEIKYFPIPSGYDSDETASYMYGDSWNAKTNRCADIIDRENIRGRIPIVSMTSGIVTELGWKDKTGFQITIKTSQDSVYTYSWMDGFADNLAVGTVVQPGAKLGYMGSASTAPVRLKLSIAPKFALSKDFLINPYPFLRLVEGSKAEYN